MSTPAEIMARAAALMNDTEQQVYIPEKVLPYLNMAFDDLQEIYEQNNIPVTDDVSTVINVPAGTTEVIFSNNPTIPTLPLDLVEIRQLWESAEGQDQWIPVTRRNFLPHYLEGQEINQFMVWSWQNNRIKLPVANVANDLKIDYVKSIFPTIVMETINLDLPMKNIKSYLSYRTASLCSMYIGENESRASMLAKDAQLALDRSLSMPIKSAQSIQTRRRPFRASYRRRSYT